MAYDLHWFPGTCARVPFVALEEIGEPYEITVINKTAAPTEEHLAANPKNKVPVLVGPTRTITENPAIAQYLHREHPEAGLLPEDPDGQLDALELMSWFAAGMHRYITPLRFPRMTTSLPEAFEDVRAHARAELEKSFTILEDRMEDREWVLGDAWSIADVHLLWLWFRATGSGMDGAAYPHLDAHAQRCEARPAVATVLDREDAELARMVDDGELAVEFPAYQTGRAPSFAGSAG